MAVFGAPTQDENLTPGWTSQGQSLGYGSQAGNTGTIYGPGQVSAGTPQPPGAGGMSAGESASQVLVNPGYADATGPGGRQLPQNIGGSTVNAPSVPATTVVATNPTSLTATVTITGGTLTVVKVGTSGQTYAQATQVGTAAGTYTVPPGGVIGITYSAAPTWTWSV